MRNVHRTTVVAVALALLSACGGSDESTDETVDAATGTAAAPADAGGMPGMAAMQDAEMMQQMQAHMQMMQGMNSDSMMAMMPRHRQMADSMLTQMGRAMGQMNGAGNSAGTALVDSLRQDLARMPGMTAQEVQAFMPGHQARMSRMMDMHRGMMGGMSR